MGMMNVKKRYVRQNKVPILAHSVMILFVHLWQFSLEVHLNLKVQITIISVVRLHLKRSIHFFTLLDRHILVEIENRLLPVRVRWFWGRAESQTLMALGKLHVKVCYQSLHEIISLHHQMKRSGKIQIGFGHGIQIHFFYQIRTGNNLKKKHVVTKIIAILHYSNSYLFGIDHIDERFGNSNLSNRAHIETIYVIPPVDLFVFILSILDSGDEQCASVREHHTVRL